MRRFIQEKLSHPNELSGPELANRYSRKELTRDLAKILENSQP